MLTASLSVVLAGALVGALLPLRYLAVLLGILLPIDYLSITSPIVLDILKYGLAVLLIVRGPKTGQLHGGVRATSIALAGIGLFAMASGVSSGHGGMLSFGFALAAPAVLAGAVSARPLLFRPVLTGLAFGLTLSALDIVFQRAGLPYLGVPSPWGLDYSGFSLKRTHTAPLLAIATILYITPHLWRTKSIGLLRGAGAIVCVTGLVLTAGRGGFLALAVAGTVWAFQTFRTRPFAVGGAILAAATVAFLQRDSHLIGRITESSERSSGRAERNEAALDAFALAPILGPDPHLAEAVSGTSAHIPILVFAVNAGLVGLIGGAIASATLLVASTLGVLRWHADSQHAALVCIVMAVTMAFEPSGFFVGLGRVVPLLICLQLVLGSKNNANGGLGEHTAQVAAARRD